MNKKNKLIILALVVIGLLFLSGCTSPVNADGTTKLITDATTFSQTFAEEDWFSAILVFPLAKVINFLTPRVSVGIAIALVTIVVNLIILAFTLKSTIASQKMQTLQPEMDKITRKYEGKDDERSKMAQANEIQALYKKNNINPFGTIISMFIQFPIIIAMYQAVQRSEAVKTATFVGLNLETKPWDAIKGGSYGYIILIAIMLIFQLLSMKLPQLIASRKAKKEAEIHHTKYKETKNPTQNMMYFMLIPIVYCSFVWPAAMTLYWAINSVITVCKTLFVQKIIDKKGA